MGLDEAEGAHFQGDFKRFKQSVEVYLRQVAGYEFEQVFGDSDFIFDL